MAEETASLILKVDSTQVEKGSKSLKDFASSGATAEASSSKLTTATNALANSAKVLASAFAALKIVQYAQEAAMLSARYETLGVSMNVLARNSGYTAKAVEDTAKALQQTGISMIESRQQVMRLIQANIDLGQATKLARIAQDAAVIGNINSSEAFSRLVFGIQSAQTEVLRNIGINVSMENSYKSMAKQLGVNQDQLSQSQKTQAILNSVMDEGARISGTYEAAMGTAGKQINSTERYVENLKVKLGGLFDDTTKTSVSAYTDLLKELDRQVDSMSASGELKDWAHRIAIEFAGLADITRVFIGQAGILFKMMSTGFSQIKGGDFAGLTKTFMNADEALKALYLDGEKYQDQVNKRVISEGMLTKQITGVNNNSVKLADTADRLNTVTSTATSKTKAYNVEIYKLKEVEKQLAGAKDIEFQKLKRHESALNEARQLTEQTRTAQEKYNASIQRYNELRPYITADVYSKAVANARMELERADQTNKQFNENWRHAWSNMEQTGRMAFTQFAAHGVNAMESIGNAIKLSIFDLLYHLTARRWIINLGTSLEGALFGAAGSAAGSAAGAGLFTGGFGKGVTGLVGRGGSMLPGALGTFFGGMAGNGAFSAAGGAGTAFIGGPGTAIGGTGMGVTAGLGARFGSMMSAAAGPLAIAFGLDAIGRLIGGNKKLGGAEKIPVIGGFLAGLFGRGPLKQKETTLTGDIGLGGLESGMLQTVFKAKGGLFRSNKTDFARVDAITGEIWTDNQKQLGQFAKDLGKAAKDIFSAFNEAAKESNKIINATAGNLGLSTESMKDFNYQLNLVSEKGKGLTEEQIAEEIEKMSSAMAEKFIPNIKELSKVNESAIEALARLNNEFLATEQAARVLGMTLADAKVYVQGMGFELRTAFTDAAGGVDSFNSKVAFVAENFLTAEQRFSMGIETLNSQLTKAGVPLDATKESFYQLLRVTAAAGDAVKFGGLLDIAPLFAQIRDAQNAAAEEQKAAIETADAWIKQAEAQHKINVMNELDLAYSSLQRSIDAEKLKITNQYNDAIKESETRIKGVTDSISNLTDISKLLKSSVASMSGFDIVAARAQVSAAIASQDFSSPALRDAITALTQKGTGFASKLEEQRYNAQNLTLLRSLDNVADDDLLLQQRSLAALQNAEKILKENHDAEIKRLDGIIDGFKQQIDALKQIDNSVLSIPGAIDRMGAAIAAAMKIATPLSSNVVSISPSVAAAPVYDSPSPISNADILAFGRSHTPMETYQAAIQYGVSSSRIAESGLYTQDQINQFVRENKLASFDVGGRVPKTGIAMIHKDEQILTKDENKSLKQSLEEMKKAIEVMTVTQNKINRRFDKWDAEGLPDTRVA